MSPKIIIFLLSMLPISELRGAIPLGVKVYDIPIWTAFFWAVIGNIVPVILILFGLDFLVNKILVHKVYFFNRFFTWLFEKTKRRHIKKFERWKDFALVVLVAIPLPFTGAWTGALAAFVFGIPPRRAIPLIVIGVLVAGLVVSLATMGIIYLPGW